MTWVKVVENMEVYYIAELELQGRHFQVLFTQQFNNLGILILLFQSSWFSPSWSQGGCPASDVTSSHTSIQKQ